MSTTRTRPNQVTAANAGERIQFTAEHIVLLVAIATSFAVDILWPGMAESIVR